MSRAFVAPHITKRTVSDNEFSPRRRLIVGDIHGMYKALVQVLERANFDPHADELISVGDLVDRGPDSREVLEFLEQLPHFRFVLGNHDEWLFMWLAGKMEAWRYAHWCGQGGRKTLLSLAEGEPVDTGNTQKIRERWLPFLRCGQDYIEIDRNLIVHGGFDPCQPIELQSGEYLRWDRSLVEALIQDLVEPEDHWAPQYDKIFLGHTPVGEGIGLQRRPIRLWKVWMIDQAAAYGGHLTLIDMETEEIWQSDLAYELYPDYFGMLQKAHAST